MQLRTAATLIRYSLIQCAHPNAIILNYVPSKDCEERYDSFMGLLDLLPEAQAQTITEKFGTIREPSCKHTLD
jgi:hypothetical protein